MADVDSDSINAPATTAVAAAESSGSGVDNEDTVDTFVAVHQVLTNRRANWSVESDGVLSELLTRLQGNYCTIGHYHFGFDQSSTVRLPKAIVNDVTVGEDWYHLDVDKLLALATPSKFGHGNQTVYDEDVRKAFSINEPRIGGGLTAVDLLPDQRVLSDFRTWGSPHLDVQLSRIHIYKEGGHFKTHRDTPHSNAHFATVVVILPNAFTGGKFVVKSPTGVSAVEAECPDDEDTVTALMFYTDCEHYIEPVTSGTRVSLQFDVSWRALSTDLFYEEDRNYDDGEEDRDGETRVLRCPSVTRVSPNIFNDIDAALKQRFVERPTQSVALMLQHQYPTRALEPVNPEATDEERFYYNDALLKGVDFELFDCLWTFAQNNDCIIALCPFRVDQDREHDVRYPHSSVKAGALDAWELQNAKRRYNDPEVPDKRRCLRSKVTLVLGNQKAFHRLVMHDKGAEFVGNEAELDTIYYCGAAIVLSKRPAAAAAKPVVESS